MIRLNNKGFTITELAIAAVVAGIVSVAVVGIVIVYYGGILRGDVESRMVVDSQIILRNIVDELRISSAVRTTNVIPDANEPTGGWSTSTDNAILIIATPARDGSGDFIIDDLTGDPYLNELVYYASDDVMYRRILANPSATGNSLETTCPAAIADASCRADSILSEEYDMLDFVFYDQDDAETADPNLARSVKMDINLARTLFGEEVRVDNSIRVTLRN